MWGVWDEGRGGEEGEGAECINGRKREHGIE